MRDADENRCAVSGYGSWVKRSGRAVSAFPRYGSVERAGVVHLAGADAQMGGELEYIPGSSGACFQVQIPAFEDGEVA